MILQYVESHNYASCDLHFFFYYQAQIGIGNADGIPTCEHATFNRPCEKYLFSRFIPQTFES